VQVEVPDVLNSPSELMASLEGLTVEVNVPARVVINERTGTIVAGGNIRISEVMVTYGSLIVSTQRQPVISQPAPFAEEGETVQDEVGSAQVEEEGVRTVVLEPNTDVNQLAAALNELGLTARDVISIFQSIDRAGALQGQLVIL
jgi:flagellar P-ring protein precursor FlgI